MQPIILLAFANDRQGKFLRNISAEQESIRKALKGIENKGYCKLIFISNASLDAIIEEFRTHKGKIKAFHYAGHGEDYALLLNSVKEKKIHADGFAQFLANQTGLELVFLNGCITDSHKKALLEVGIKHMLLTSSSISDEVAEDFAKSFYQSLASGNNVQKCFEEAASQIKSSKGSDIRAFVRDSLNPSNFPWELVIHPRVTTPWKLKVKRTPAWVYAAFTSLLILLSSGAFITLGSAPEPFELKVKVQGEENDPAIDDGEVVLELSDQILHRQIDQDRMAIFKIPPSYTRKHGKLSFRHNQPYEAIWKDSVIKLEENLVMEIPVKLQGLDLIRGYIYDFNTDVPLPNVQVRIKGIDTKTDSLGNFTLRIPDSLQQKYQDVFFRKKGYNMEFLSRYSVHTQKEIQLPLTPI